MTQELIDDLLAYCRSELGEDLRVFTRYGTDVHDHIYTREDIREEFDEESRGAFRYPLMQMHNAAWQMYDVHTFIDAPDAAMYAYGDVLFIQFPITEEEGILVTLDWEGELPEAFLAECKAIIRGSEWERNPGSGQ